MTTTARALSPDDSGQVYIATRAGLRGIVSAEFVGCQAQFTCSPAIDGYQANGVQAFADGTIDWILGDLGNIPVVELSEGSYTALGWNLTVANDGALHVTNAGTGKAFSIHQDRVEAL